MRLRKQMRRGIISKNDYAARKGQKTFKRKFWKKFKRFCDTFDQYHFNKVEANPEYCNQYPRKPHTHMMLVLESNGERCREFFCCYSGIPRHGLMTFLKKAAFIMDIDLGKEAEIWTLKSELADRIKW